MDHTKSTKLVMAAAKKSHMPVTDAPSALDNDQQSMLSDLQGKTGKDFVPAYLADQARAHQKALELQEAYAMGGSDPHFKAKAKKIVPVTKMHIHMLKSKGRLIGEPTGMEAPSSIPRPLPDAPNKRDA